MRKCLATILLILASSMAWAASGQLTTSAATCTTTGVTCLIVSVPQSRGAAGLVISGTWTGTITFEASADDGITWVTINVMPIAATTAVTTATANGVWQVNPAGLTRIRMRASATMTGTAIVTINLSDASFAR